MLRDYVAHTPGIEHHVLGRAVPGEDVVSDLRAAGADVRLLPPGTAAAVREVSSVARAVRPDLLHAHSSIAGLYVRSAPGVRRRAIVYTPHGYAFERRDVSSAARVLFQVAERLMMVRTAAVIAVAAREAELAQKLAVGKPVHLVHNAVDVRPRALPGASSGTGVVGAGRLTAAKDPAFFAAAARVARRTAPEITWTWLGGGDDRMAQHLQESGVEVSGWLTRDELLRRMSAASVYVHSAAWEGCPVTLLEAAGLGLPIVAREIPALSAMRLPGLVSSPEALAARVLDLAAPGRRVAAAALSQEIARRHSPQEQARQLRAAYEAVGAALR